MAETVSDILGKGLVIENRVIVETLTEERMTGTIPAFIGGAHWGIVNQPILVYKDFAKYLGTPVVAEDENDNRALDFSGLAAEYHLKYSNYCYFTRISDGTDTAASRLLKKDAEYAKLYGNGAIKNTTVTIFPEDSGTNSQNNIFVITKDDVIKVVQIAGSSSAKATIDISAFDPVALAGSKMIFTIDGKTLITYTVPSNCTLDMLQAYLASTWTITLAEAQAYVYALTINDIDLLGETYENGDAVQIADEIFMFDGTTWAEITFTEVAVDPVVNPLDGAILINITPGSEDLWIFDKTGHAFVNTSNFSVAAVAPDPAVVGDYYYNTGDSKLYLGVAGPVWQEVVAFTIVIATPVVLAEGYYYNTTDDELFFFDYDLNTSAEITFDVIDYLVFDSKNYGKTSSINIYNFPGSEYNESNTLSVIGQDSAINEIVASINTQVATDTTPAVPGDIGLWKKSGGVWTQVETTEIYTTKPVAPVDGDFWKSDGSGDDPFGWYEYQTDAWVALGFIQFGDAKPADIFGSNDDYFDVTGSVAIDDLLIGFDAYDRFYIQTENAGVAESFMVLTADGSIYSLLLMNVSDLDVEKIGVDEMIGGRIEAVYTGEGGNEILLFCTTQKEGEQLQIIKGSEILGTFYDYSYTVADDNFIGTMINTDRTAGQYVQVLVDSGMTELPPFTQNLAMYLSGGTSGLNNLQDFMYVAALQDYRNLDLYDIDIVAIPGLISETVVDAMDALAQYRKDCFVITDTPQSMSPYLVERWHKGLSDTRTTSFDSEFTSLYYPWLLVETSSARLPQQWVPPSVRVVGAVGFCDNISQNKLNPPAGFKNTPIFEVEALERYLEETDKQTLYSDRLDNNINPIVYTKRNGYFIDGQKTTKRGLTPLNRLKALRTNLTIKRRLFEIAPKYFWLPVGVRTRSKLEAELKSMMTEYVEAQAIKDDFQVIVDDTLNTELVEADSGLIAKIIWSPIKSVERIKIINVIKDQQVSVQFEL